MSKKYRKKELTYIKELIDQYEYDYIDGEKVEYIFEYGQMVHVPSVSSMCFGLLYPAYDARIIDRIYMTEYSHLKNGTSLYPDDYAYLVQKKYKNGSWSKPFPLCLDNGQGEGTKIKYKSVREKKLSRIIK
jgi:hypothetical protein